MLAIGPKVYGFKPKDDGFLRVMKIHSMTFFGGEVSAEGIMSLIHSM
jgi:hypothetical protein